MSKIVLLISHSLSQTGYGKIDLIFGTSTAVRIGNFKQNSKGQGTTAVAKLGASVEEMAVKTLTISVEI